MKTHSYFSLSLGAYIRQAVGSVVALAIVVTAASAEDIICPETYYPCGSNLCCPE